GFRRLVQDNRKYQLGTSLVPFQLLKMRHGKENGLVVVADVPLGLGGPKGAPLDVADDYIKVLVLFGDQISPDRDGDRLNVLSGGKVHRAAGKLSAKIKLVGAEDSPQAADRPFGTGCAT